LREANIKGNFPECDPREKMPEGTAARAKMGERRACCGIIPTAARGKPLESEMSRRIMAEIGEVSRFKRGIFSP